MTTKIYGVDMGVVQKLRQFQFLLMQRKLSKAEGKPFDKMDFIGLVQLKSEKGEIPVIRQISVASATIYIEEQSVHVIVLKGGIRRLETNDNNVTLNFKVPGMFFGSFLSFDFNNSESKQSFLNALGEIEVDSDESIDADTPPSSGTDKAD